MSSFYAELEVAGSTYPVRQCGFEFAQATSQRGRVQARVRHGLVHLALDVPPDEALLAWAATPFKAQPGHVTFFADDQRTAHETLSFTAGQCVSYQEVFVAGDANVGAYLCQLTLAAEHLALAPSGLARAPAVEMVRDAVSSEPQRPEASQIVAIATPLAAIRIGGTTPLSAKQQLARLVTLRRAYKSRKLSETEETEAVGLLATALGIHVQEFSQLTSKPKHSPVPLKWHNKGGKIEVLSTGYWQYTDWEGNTVTYEQDEPNFNMYARQQVDIDDMQGDCTSDFVKANDNAPLGHKENMNTWHHKNNLRTMQEVPRIIHDRFTHYGARSIIRKRKTPLFPLANVASNAPIIRKRKR